MKVFHASSADFEFPDYEELLKNITNHDNGALGLWCAASDHWIKGFGGNTYEVHYDGAKAFNIPFSEFYKMCHPDDYEGKEYFVNKRNEYISNGIDVLHIVESSGSIDMLIIMNMDAITSFKKKRVI